MQIIRTRTANIEIDTLTSLFYYILEVVNTNYVFFFKHVPFLLSYHSIVTKKTKNLAINNETWKSKLRKIYFKA